MKHQPNHKLTIAIRTILWGIPLISASLTTTAIYAANNQNFSISPNALDQVLKQLAIQANISMSYNANELSSISSEGLKGNYSADQALKMLLQPQNLEAIKLEKGGYVIRRTNDKKIVSNLTRNTIINTEDNQLPTIHAVAEGNHSPLQEKATLGILGNKTILDTPYSVSVKTAEEIENRQVNSLGKIFVGDPSIVTQVNSYSSGWSTPVSIRGLKLDESNGYKVNGYTISAWGGEFPIEVVESVTALKGLTGLMYGFASPGGTIDYKTKQPTDDNLLTTTLGYRSGNILNAHIDAGGRLGEDQQFGYRINLAKEKGESYNGTDVDNTVTSIAVDYKILPNLVWKGEIIYQDRQLDNEASMLSWWGYTGKTLPKPIDGSNKNIVKGAFYTMHSALADTGLYWQINDDWKAEFTYGYARGRNYVNKTFAYVLNESGDYNINMYQLGGVGIREQTQALLNGQFNTGSIAHDFTVGAAYKKNSGSDSDYNWYPNVGVGNIYKEQTTSYANTSTFSQTDSANRYQKEIFTSDTIKFNENWQILLGARFTDYNNTASDYQTNVVTPTYALIYKPVENLSIYGSYVEALEEGTLVSASTSKPYANAGTFLDPTISKQYEIGIKYDNTQWSASAALYRLDRAANIDETRNDQLYLTQNGITRYQGLELIGGYQFNNDLNINLGLLFADPTIEKVSDTNKAIEGNRPEGASKFQAVIQTDWNTPYWEGVSLHGDVRYYGDNYYDNTNTLIFPDYTLVNIGASYKTQISNKPVTFRADMNNLFNKKYWMDSGAGEPSTISFSAKVDW